MTTLWQALSDGLGFGRHRRGGLGSQNIKAAKKSEFFRWFSFSEIETVKGENGNAVASFRPTGGKFDRLVTLRVVLDDRHCICQLHLSLDMSFVGDEKDGMFARDIAKSFLRAALPRADANSAAVLADEIAFRHEFPVITHATLPRPPLPAEPTPGFLAFTGQRQLFEAIYSQSSLRIEQTRTDSGTTVVLSISTKHDS